MDVNNIQRISTPKLHQKTILLVGTLNPAPTPIAIGAPTVIVPSKPNPITPYFSHIFKIKPGSDLGFSSFDLRNLFTHFLILSPKYAETNNLKNTSIQISDGKLKFISTKVANPLTFKYIEKSLGEVIKNENQVKQIVDYLKNNRDIKVTQEIKRFSNN